MHLTDTKIVYGSLCLVSILLSACGGGGGSSASGPTTVYSAYVANSGDGTISQYTIGPSGALTWKATIQSIVGKPTSGPSSITVHPSGKYAYVANSGLYLPANEISQFTIGQGGVLVAMATATVPTGGNTPVSVAVDPTGKYAYVANSQSDDISLFTIDAGGALSPITSMLTVPTGPAGSWPISVVVDSTGKYVYVANQISNDVSAYTIIVNTGELVQITCSGGVTVCNGSNFLAGTYPASIAVAGDSTGSKYVYVANHGDVNNIPTPLPATVSQYSIGVNGALLPIGTITVGAPATTSVTVAGDSIGSKYVYVTSGDNVSQYTINPDGTLAVPVTNPTIPTGSTPQSVTVAGDNIGSKYVYVANTNSHDISQYWIDATGALWDIALPIGAHV